MDRPLEAEWLIHDSVNWTSMLTTILGLLNVALAKTHPWELSFGKLNFPIPKQVQGTQCLDMGHDKEPSTSTNTSGSGTFGDVGGWSTSEMVYLKLALIPVYHFIPPCQGTRSRECSLRDILLFIDGEVFIWGCELVRIVACSFSFSSKLTKARWIYNI
jgi:hypothetical protein